MSEQNVLAQIQRQLHAPKGQTNQFGGYNFRSAEDILAAVKPICSELNQAVMLIDEIVLVGDRHYIKATASLYPLGVSTVAYAREQETKKGMDAAQITGSASSYARKYALSGLLAIDNEQDPDHKDNSGPLYTEQQKQAFDDFLSSSALGLAMFRKRVGDEIYIDLYNSFDKDKMKNKGLADMQERIGLDVFNQILEAIQNEDELGAKELLEDESKTVVALVMSQLSGPQSKTLKYMLEQK